MPHFNSCLLAWGSNIKARHKLHLLQKKLRIIDGSHITLPILNQSVKKLQVVKLTDMFRISAWKFYYKLSNNLLPSYFNYMKPSLPVICNYYGIRNPKIYLPPIKHAFAEQMIQYCLIKQLNNDIYASHIINCIHQHTFCKFKSGLTLYDRGGGALKAPPPLRFFALTHLILELHYCALRTFPNK